MVSQVGQPELNAFLAAYDRSIAYWEPQPGLETRDHAQTEFEKAHQQLEASAWPGHFTGRCQQEQQLTKFLLKAQGE